MEEGGSGDSHLRGTGTGTQGGYARFGEKRRVVSWLIRKIITGGQRDLGVGEGNYNWGGPSKGTETGCRLKN